MDESCARACLGGSTPPMVRRTAITIAGFRALRMTDVLSSVVETLLRGTWSRWAWTDRWRIVRRRYRRRGRALRRFGRYRCARRDRYSLGRRRCGPGRRELARQRVVLR